MDTPPVRVERRIGQRFPYLLPVSLRQPTAEVEGLGFTQNLSSRGVFFFTDAPLRESSAIEITLSMPSEITLGETMRVRCHGHILRIIKPNADSVSGEKLGTETKIGVAVRLERYEYLNDADSSFTRASAMSSHREEEHELVHASVQH